MNKPKYNFFEQIRYAIFKPMEYFRLTKVSGGRMTGFVFLFVCITSLFTLIPISYSIAGPNGFVKYLREDLPSFQLDNGELNVDDRFEEKDAGTYVLVDTSIDQFTINDVDYSYTQAILISKTNMIIYQLNSTKEYNFSDFKSLNLNNNLVHKLIPFFYFLMAIMAVLTYLVIVGIYFFIALIYSLIGLIVASIIHVNVPFGTLFKIAIYGRVTSAILSALLNVIPVQIPGIISFLVLNAITCLYVIYGIKSFHSDAAREEDELNAPPQNPFI